MKTIVKTSIKGNENTTVKESVEHVFEELCKKPSFILLTKVYNDVETKIIIRKSVIKMVFQR